MAYVYFIKACGANPAIKIGVSADADKRLAQLQTGNHLELQLLGKVPVRDADGLERSLHDHFADLRLEGEWFKFDERITRMMSALILHVESACPPYEQTEEGAKLRRQLAQPVRRSSVRSVLGDAGWWVVEWSDRDGMLHVQPLLQSLSMSTERALFGARPHGGGDFQIIAICKDGDEAEAVAAEIEPALRAMRDARRLLNEVP